MANASRAEHVAPPSHGADLDPLMALTVGPAPDFKSVAGGRRGSADDLEAPPSPKGGPAVHGGYQGGHNHDGSPDFPPPPAYDEAAMLWMAGQPMPPPPSYHSMAPAAGAAGAAAGGDDLHGWEHVENPGARPEGSPDPALAFDIAEASRLRRQVVVWSAACLLVNLAMLMIGSEHKRSAGPYTYANFATLIAFMIGCAMFIPAQRLSIVTFGKVYFAFLYVLWVVGTPLSVSYMFSLRSRLEGYCSRPDIQCDDARRAQLLNIGLIGGSLGCVVWFFVFSFYPRVIFVFLVATERSFGVTYGPDSKISGWMVTLNAWLPNWYALGRACNRSRRLCCRAMGCEGAVIRDCSCDACARCSDECYEGARCMGGACHSCVTLSGRCDDSSFWVVCCCCYFSWMLIAIVMCAISSTGQQHKDADGKTSTTSGWCALAEIMFRILAEMLKSR